MENLIAFLNSIHPLSEKLRDYLLDHLKLKEITKKEYLLKAGRRCEHIYFIQSGLVRCFYMNRSVEVSSWFMKEGDVIISVESFFQQKPSYEYLQALEDSVLYYISYQELQFIYREFPEFNFIGRILTEKYYALSEQRLYSIRMKTGPERYKFLMDNFPELILRVPSKFLASYLGITEVWLSKIRGR